MFFDSLLILVTRHPERCGVFGRIPGFHLQAEAIPTVAAHTAEIPKCAPHGEPLVLNEQEVLGFDSRRQPLPVTLRRRTSKF